MADYAGYDLFGLVLEMNTVPLPVARQFNGYPGVNGVQSVYLGGRGGITTARGWLVAPDVLTLNGLILTATALQQGGGANWFYDNLGTPWPAVLLEQYATHGPICEATGYGVGKRYEALLHHLIMEP